MILNAIRDKMKNYNNMYNSPEARENLLQESKQKQLLLEYNNNNNSDEDENEDGGGNGKFSNSPTYGGRNRRGSTQMSKQFQRQLSKNSNNNNYNNTNDNYNSSSDEDGDKEIETESFLLYSKLQSQVIDYEKLRQDNKKLEIKLKSQENSLLYAEKTYGTKSNLLDIQIKAVIEEIEMKEKAYSQRMEIVVAVSSSLMSLYSSVSDYIRYFLCI